MRRLAIQIGEAGANDPAKMEESFFVDLVSAQIPGRSQNREETR
jgi:hypothetical protein